MRYICLLLIVYLLFLGSAYSRNGLADLLMSQTPLFTAFDPGLDLYLDSTVYVWTSIPRLEPLDLVLHLQNFCLATECSPTHTRLYSL